MQIEQMVSVVIRMIAGFFLVMHVAQFVLSASSIFGAVTSGAFAGATSLIVLAPLVIIGAELMVFKKSRVLAQWLLKGA